GAAASTLARSAAAARTFTSWLASTGQLPHDVGGRLRAPRRGRHLPTVLSAEQAASLLTTAGPEGPTGSNSSTDHPVDQEPGSDPLQRAVALRDLAGVAMLYSSGLRGAEPVERASSGIYRGLRPARDTRKR